MKHKRIMYSFGGRVDHHFGYEDLKKRKQNLAKCEILSILASRSNRRQKKKYQCRFMKWAW